MRVRDFLHYSLGIMSKESFELAYDGPILRDGNIDVYDLAPSLLALGDLVRDINRAVNGDSVTASVQVQSNFPTGSFIVNLTIDQNVIDAVKAALIVGSMVNAQDLIKLIFGDATVGDVIKSLFGVFKRFKGEKPTPTTVNIKDSLLIFGGVRVDARVGKMYLDDTVRRSLEKVVRPLAKAGIDKMEARKDHEVIQEITKQDVPERLLSAGEGQQPDDALSNTREALVKVVTANFEKGKWRFSDGTASFSADLEDDAFRGRIDRKEVGFFKGDYLRVMLKTLQTLKPDGKLSTKYSIIEVVEYRPASRQGPLLEQ